MHRARSSQYLLDLTRNYLIGPLRVIVPALGYLILYRLIYSTGGLAVIGIWSLLSAAFAYTQVADVGFSQLVARELAGARDEADREDAWQDISAVCRLYAAVGVFLVTVVLVCGGVATSRLPASVGSYDTSGLWIAAVMVTVTSVILLEVRLFEAALAALHKATYASLAQILTSVVTFAVAIAGTLRGKPLEALAVGYAAGSGLHLWLLSRELRTERGARPLLQGRSHTYARDRVKAMVVRGRGLYAANVALFLREPAFRVVIAMIVGLPAAGVVDIARRVTSLIRNAVSVGAMPLYPALSWSTKAGEWSHVRSLVSSGATVLVFLGAATLAVFTALAPDAYRLWLGEVPDGIIVATLILSVWNIWILFGTPFWYLLLAVGGERGAAGAIWLQLVLLGALMILGMAYSFGLETTLYLWLLSALPTQLIIYHQIETRFGLFWSAVLRSGALRDGIGSLLLYLAAVGLAQGRHPPYGSLALVVAFTLFGGALVWPRLQDLRCAARN